MYFFQNGLTHQPFNPKYQYNIVAYKKELKEKSG